VTDEAFWDALQARNYAEEGIPMLVVVEVLGVATPGPAEPGLAEAFEAAVDKLRAARPITPAGVIELLAARELDALPVP
jgi:hypothetical protein